MLGAWKIDINVNGMPQKVATAFGKLSEQLIGAEYAPIAYLGSQQVNGINHAVLAEQVVLSGRDTKNVVLIIFNEKGMECDLVNIERVVEGGGALGGTIIDVKTDIPEDAQKAFETTLAGFVGSAIQPFALLATQVTKGVNYVFAAKVTPVVAEPEDAVAIVTVNAMEKKVSFADVLKSELQVALGCPLGEWP